MLKRLFTQYIEQQDLNRSDYVGLFQIVVIFAVFLSFIVTAYNVGYNAGKVAAFDAQDTKNISNDIE